MANELILIIEDNEPNRRLARDVLQFHGFRTVEAANAAEGIAAARAELPHVVLLDIKLPDMDGVAALQQIRQTRETATIPVVALTAFAMEPDRNRLSDAGFDGYMAKPIDIKRFADQVRRYCRP